MNWEAIGALGEIFSAAAVLITLVFLVIQLRQSNRLGEAEAERDWFSTWHTLVEKAMGSEEAVVLFRKGLHEYAALTPNEQAVFSTRMIAMFDHVDVLRRLHHKGYVADDLLEPLIKVLSSMVVTPGGRDWWKEIGPMLSIYRYFEKERISEVVPFYELLPPFSKTG